MNKRLARWVITAVHPLWNECEANTRNFCELAPNSFLTQVTGSRAVKQGECARLLHEEGYNIFLLQPAISEVVIIRLELHLGHLPPGNPVVKTFPQWSLHSEGMGVPVSMQFQPQAEVMLFVSQVQRSASQSPGSER